MSSRFNKFFIPRKPLKIKALRVRGHELELEIHRGGLRYFRGKPGKTGVETYLGRFQTPVLGSHDGILKLPNNLYVIGPIDKYAFNGIV